MPDGDAKPTPPHEGRRFVGAAVPRPDGRSKVLGATRYVDDLPFGVAGHDADGLYGATVRTDAPRGTITGIRFGDLSDLGVDWTEFAVVMASDIPRRGPDGRDPNVVALIEQDQPFLVRDVFKHRHEPVALIAHPSLEIVREAVRRVHISYEALPPVLDYREPPAAELVQFGPSDVKAEDRNCFKHIHVRRGLGEDAADGGARPEFEAVFANAAKVVTGVYETQAQEQCYIETQGVIARVHVDPSEREGSTWPKLPWKAEVEGSIQCPYYVHKALTSLTGLPAESVRVIADPAGGGFGGKEEYPSILAGHALLLALKTRRPVKMIYERGEDMVATTKRHPCQSKLRTAHDAEGRLLAIEIDCRMDGGAYATLSAVVLSRGIIHAVGPYRVDHVRVDGRAVLTNTPPHGAFRGFGAPQTIFAMERHLDRVAAAFDLDPAELRRRNLVVRGDTLAVSQTIDEAIELHAWQQQALDAIEWDRRRADAATFNAAQRASGGPLRRGVGMATFMHGAGFTGSGEDYLASKLKVRATTAGGIEVCSAQTEIGQGSIGIFSQIAAEATGLELRDIGIARPDTDHVPNSGPTVASRTSMVVGHLVARAVDDLVARLETAGLLQSADLRPASEAAHEAPSAMTKGRGRDYQADALRRALAAAAATGDAAVAEGWAQYKRPPGGAWDDKLYKGVAYGTYAWATYVAAVQVDVGTGETKVEHFVASQEIGRVLNPTLADGQIAGGVVQAIGWALLEDCVWQDGGMRNGNMTNYVVPTAADVPRIDVRFQESPYAYGPWGAKGIGELPMDGPAPAVVNAIAHATGLDLCAIPASPERVLAAWDAAHPDGQEAA